MDSRLHGNDVEVESSSSRTRGSKRYPKLHTNLATIHETLWIPAFAGMTGDDVGGSGGPAAKGPTKPHRAQADAPTRMPLHSPQPSSFPLQPSSSRTRGSKRHPKLHTNLATIHEAQWIPAFAGMTGDGVGGSGGPAAKGPTKTPRAQADAPTSRVKPPTS
jgi:hypothetical protein